MTKLLSYWKQQLSDLPPLLELPGYLKRPSQEFCDGGQLSFPISRFISQELHRFSKQSDTSLFVILLAAFNTLLYRYTNQEDIVIGNLIKGHKINEKGELDDCVLNTVVLRTRLSGDPVFEELLSRVREVVLEASAYKDLPFEILVKAISPEKGPDHTSLFKVMFEYQNDDIPVSETDVLTGCAQQGNPSVDLTLSIQDTTNGLEGIWKYNSNMFDAKSIERIADNFRVLLESILANSGQPISQLSIISAEERHQVLFGWNNRYAEYSSDKCIHELFEEQVKRTPDAVAVTLFGSGMTPPGVSRELTYSELNKKANQLAHYLRELGVGPEVLVGIYADRSLELMVGLLGVLKAGGAYLPLDPSYPKQRIAFMLRDARVSIVLTKQDLLKDLPPLEGSKVCLDTDWTRIDQYSSENTFSGVKPENLAYVIYTSGSTGMPKGTLIVHRGVVNYLCWCIKAYAVAEGHGSPVNSSIAFDATITSFFSPLLVGQRVLLLPEEAEIEALSSALLSKSRFSLVKITPAHLQILSQLLPADQMKGQTNALIIGGENLPGRYLELWLNHAPGTRLINEYGPTETVVGCCTYEVSGKNPLSEDIPIGRPIANTQMYILDAHLEPVPIGVAGEIYIGGAGLARGYLNREDLTAERFISNPFIDDANSRLYKTGDLGRYLSDGTIVFLGRIDHQIKIRGYRIELGEIESALGQHPSVQQVVVIAREDSPGDKRLVAYLALNHGHKPATGDLRRFLEEKLPEYMIPSTFVFLEKLPLTPNLKVDRSALPVPDYERPELEKGFLAPRNLLELTLTKIFEECLKVHPMGVQDNFFELGANSIQAAFIFSQIRKTLGKPLHLAVLLQCPTIEQLASYLDREAIAIPWSSLVPIQPRGSKPPLFCVHGGIGTVLFYRDLAKNLGPDQPFYGLQAKGLNGIEVPHSRIEEMAAQYIHEIRSVQPEGPYFLGGYCFGAVVAFEMAKQLTRQGHVVSLLANFNGVSPTYAGSSRLKNKIDEEQLYGRTSSGSSMFSNLRNEMKLLTIKEKLIHILRILKHTSLSQMNFKQWNQKLQYNLRRIIYRFCITLGRPLPEALAKYYLWETNSNMVKAYPRYSYQGRMIIFRSPEIYHDPHLGWDSLVEGGIETCDISGEHQYPRQIMIEPYVQQLAEKLRNYVRAEK